MKKINFKLVAMKAAGHVGGAIVAAKVSNLGFIKKLGETDGKADPKKQAVKGAVVAAIGYIGLPMLTKKLGKNNPLLEAVGEGCGMVGMLQVAGALDATGKLGVPKISGVDGYEENPINGLGELFEEESVSGYEDNPSLSDNVTDSLMFED